MQNLRSVKLSLQRGLSILGLKQVPSRLALTLKNEGLTYLNNDKLLRIEAATATVDAEKVPGCFVEFGVALGGSAVLLAHSARAGGRSFHGFDVFSTIPEPTSDKDDAKSK